MGIWVACEAGEVVAGLWRCELARAGRRRRKGSGRRRSGRGMCSEEIMIRSSMQSRISWQWGSGGRWIGCAILGFRFGVGSILRVGNCWIGSCNRGEASVKSPHWQGRYFLGGNQYTVSLARDSKCIGYSHLWEYSTFNSLIIFLSIQNITLLPPMLLPTHFILSVCVYSSCLFRHLCY